MIQEIVSCLVDYLIFLWFNKMYETRKYGRVRVTVLFFVMLAVVRLTNVFGLLNPAIRLICPSIYYFSAIWILYANISPLHRLFRTGILMVTVAVTELLAMAIVLIGVDGAVYKTIMDIVGYWFLTLVVTRICEVIFLNLMNKMYFSKRKEVSCKEVLWHGLFLGSILAYLYIIVRTVYLNPIEKETIEITFWINISFIILALIGYYFFWKLFVEKNHQKELLERLLQKQEIQVDYYKRMNYYEKELRKIKHDLKNQLIIVESMKGESLIDQYRSEVDNLFAVYVNSINSGNEILDILLKNKLAFCNEKNIEFSVNVNFKRGGFIDLTDIGVIFGNIIDNAIEACMRMETGKRRIHLSVFENEEFIMIKLHNSYDKIKLKGKRFVSLKEDARNHGIGLYSLEQTVKKYDGNCRYNVEDKEFQLNILIPIKVSN